MVNSFSLILMSALFMIILILYFISKEHVNTLELKLYKGLMLINFAGLLLEMGCGICIRFFADNMFLTIIVNKVYLLYFVFFALMFSLYTLLISHDNKTYSSYMEKYRKFLYIFVGIVVALVLYLPIEFHSGDVVYSYGKAVSLIYGYSFINIFFCIAVLIAKFRNIKRQQYAPLIFYIFGSGVVGLIQYFHPEFTLSTTIDALVLFVMYFTIENPDIRMLNEVYKNKELVEQGYEDKYNFLFEMTQETKKPILDLNRICNELRNEDDPKKIKNGLEIVSNLTRQLDFSVNNVLNVSSFDVQKLKMIDTKYEILKICEGLESTLKNEIKENVSFVMDLPENVPVLYGDYMKIRQILYSLLNNAIKNTENGSVSFHLNIIEKYDFCRLIFNISDTGAGMSIDKINDILSSTGELDKNELEILEKKEFNFKVCQKVVKIMGGNLMIKSTLGKGTDVTLTLDQRVYHKEENSILNQYESAISTSKRVLLVTQNKDLTNYIKKKLNNNNITYSSLAFGGDALDRIKSGKSYDYIIVQDEMNEMSGLATLNELKKLKNFDIPVIVTLNKDKENIKHHYIEDGFADYILADKLEDELIRIINKY